MITCFKQKVRRVHVDEGHNVPARRPQAECALGVLARFERGDRVLYALCGLITAQSQFRAAAQHDRGERLAH